MGKKRSTKTFDSEPAYSRLRTTCFKLRGMSYLIEFCGNHPCPPLDEDDAFYGISVILGELHDEVRTVAREIEADDIAGAQRLKKEESK